MSLFNFVEFLLCMVSDLCVYFVECGIEWLCFVGIYIGGIWVVEVLLRELGN